MRVAIWAKGINCIRFAAVRIAGTVEANKYSRFLLGIWPDQRIKTLAKSADARTGETRDGKYIICLDSALSTAKIRPLRLFKESLIVKTDDPGGGMNIHKPKPAHSWREMCHEQTRESVRS